MKLGKHRLNTCHAYIAITLAGIINILDTEAVLMTLVWTDLDTKCRTDHQHCSTDEDTADTWHWHLTHLTLDILVDTIN